jgi:TetR/AcrR family transcriptional regulator, copper-responsive repressor
MANPRGRPRQYDRDEVLDKAMQVFWGQGFAATSLDDLTAAMGMTRPSLYNAFGDKEAVYRLALARFVAALRAQADEALFDGSDLKKALRKFFRAALEVYFSSDPAPGCFIMCTAPVEALAHPDVRHDLMLVIDEIDDILEQRFEKARADKQFPKGGNTNAAAKLAQALLHSIALRARAGQSKASLRKLADGAVTTLCGAT